MKAEWANVIAAGIVAAAIVGAAVYVMERSRFEIVPASSDTFSAAYVMDKKTGETTFYIQQKKLYTIEGNLVEKNDEALRRLGLIK